MSSPTTPLIDVTKLFQTVVTPYLVIRANDPEFTIIEENQAHAKVAMVKREDILGRPFLDVFPDTSEEFKETGKSELIESFRRVIKSGKPDTLENLKYDIHDPAGRLKQKYWRATHYPIFDDDKKVVALYQITQDISEEVLASWELKRTRYQLDQALSNGAIGIWQWDILSERVYADPNLSELFGLSAEQGEKGLSVDTFLESIHPDDRERVQSEINHVLRRRQEYESEYRVINSHGEVRWVIARGQVEVSDSETPISFPGVIMDITERRSAENNLRFLAKASTQFSASLDRTEILNNITAMAVPEVADWCAVELLDDNGVLQQVAVAHKDPERVAWAKQLRSEQGAPDMNATMGAPQVVRTGQPVLYPEITDEMLKQAAKSKKELELARSIGFASVIIAPMKLEGKVIGVISFISAESRVHFTEADLEMAEGLANRAALAVYNASLYQSSQYEINERKRLQEELERINAELENRVAERTHQLEETNKGLQEEISRRRSVEQELQLNSKNLARSNQELQDFAYVASHDLQEPLRKIQAFGNLLDSEYGEILGEGRDYLERMRGAASRMSILIEDLLSFSRVNTKAQPSRLVDMNKIADEVTGDLETAIEDVDGKVVIKKLPKVMADPTHMRQLLQNLIGNGLKFHRQDVPPEVVVTGREIGKNIEITVSDNGIGFEDKYLEKIFAVFQRLHGRDAYTGTGIGLAVCRKIVERYGGTITARSRIGEGATFIITLPKRSKGTRE